MSSRKNVWRNIGRNGLQVRRETARLSDGSPWGDVLWFRTARDSNKTRGVAYVHDRGTGLELGLGTYWPGKRDANGEWHYSPRNAISAAHAIRITLNTPR